MTSTTTPTIRCTECEGLGRVVYTTPTGGLSTKTCTVCDGQGRLPICPICGDEWCDRPVAGWDR